MKFSRLLLILLGYILLPLVLLGISLFLNMKGNIIFFNIIMILGAGCIAWGFPGIIKKKYKEILKVH